MIYGSAKEWLNGFKSDWKSGKGMLPIIEIIISSFMLVMFIIGMINGFRSLTPTNVEPIVIYNESESLSKQKLESEQFTYDNIYAFNSSNEEYLELKLKYEPVPNSLNITWEKVSLPLDSFSANKNILVIYKDKIPKDYNSQPYTWDDLRVTYRKIVK